jgi:hypothetical protein
MAPGTGVDEPSLVDVTADDQGFLRAFYDEVLAPAFPADELAAFAVLATRVGSVAAPGAVVVAGEVTDRSSAGSSASPSRTAGHCS